MRAITASLILALWVGAAHAERMPGARLVPRVPTATKLATTDTPAPTPTPRITDTPANTFVPTATAVAVPTPVSYATTSGVYFAYVTVDQTITATTGHPLVNITDLTLSFPSGAYTFVIYTHLSVTASDGTGGTYNMSSTNLSSSKGQFLCSAGNATGNLRNEPSVLASQTGNCHAPGTPPSDGIVDWNITVVQASSAGSLQVQFSKLGTVGVDNIIIRKGSYILVERVA